MNHTHTHTPTMEIWTLTVETDEQEAVWNTILRFCFVRDTQRRRKQTHASGDRGDKKRV